MQLAPVSPPSPFHSLFATVPRSLLQEGAAFFQLGGVLRIDSGPDEVLADVAGVTAAPHEVQLLRTSDGITARCDCGGAAACRHIVAVAFALDPARLPAVMAAPDAVAAAAAHEREARLKSAKSEPFELRARPRGHAFGAFRVHSSRSRADYDVLWLGPDFVWCSCADIRTSELPTCKHIEFVRLAVTPRGPAASPVAVVAAADTRARCHQPLADVRLFAPAAPPSIRALLDERGFVIPARLGEPARAVQTLRARLAGWRALTVRPEVTALLDRLDVAARTASRLAPFEAAVRRSLAGEGPPPPEWARLVAALRVPLHPYQVEGVLFIARTRRALLGDDMGLGKTFQAIAATRLLIELGEVERALVVCPSSLKHQWANEARKLLGDATLALVVEGGRREREQLYRTSTARLLIVNYEVLIKDLPLLRVLAPDLVIADEAQRIKNWNTKTAKAVKALPSPRALVLTGTPMENRLAELHSVVEHLDERALGPMWRLSPEFAEFEITGEGPSRRPRVTGFHGLDLLRTRLKPLLLRRERALVLSQLPERTDQIHPVLFTREQALLHDEHAGNAARIAAKRFLTEVDVLRLMAELTNMRMIANGLLLYHFEKVEPALAGGRLPEALRAKYPSPKLDELGEVLAGLLAQVGTRVVIFSQWERMQRLAAAAVRSVLDEAAVKPLFFNGRLSSRERAQVVTAFHEDPAARVLFSTDAGGVGLNLQEAASALIHLELPWNPAVFEQRVGRIHRMGQRRPIQVVSLVSENCIEARIAQVIEQKRALFDGLFRGDSDEVRFDDESRGSLVDKVKELLKDVQIRPALPGTEIVERPRSIDEETRQVEHGVADLAPLATPAPSAPGAAAASASEASAPAFAVTSPALSFDLGGAAAGLLGLLGLPASAAASLPVTVRRHNGRLAIELPDVPEAAWEHLSRFVAALAPPSGAG